MWTSYDTVFATVFLSAVVVAAYGVELLKRLWRLWCANSCDSLCGVDERKMGPTGIARRTLPRMPGVSVREL